MARVSILETFGLSPARTRLREAILTFRGDPLTPKSRFGPSSLRMFKPRIALALWRGARARGRLVPIYNLYCYTQPPPELGWSVLVTNARDFLGTQLTYDSHNGTDLAVPPGTTVVAPAAARVLRVSNEFNRGGLKTFLDHGRGLITTQNHLARVLVKPGDIVKRGEPIALSGYSGLDGLLTFPWGAPHVHFNVWLDGEYVDPFAVPGVVPLWRTGNWPTPMPAGGEDDALEPTEWDEAEIARGIDACLHDEARREIASYTRTFERGAALLFQANYFPTRFRERPRLYPTKHARTPRLDLPFSRDDYDGIWFPHGTEPKTGA